MVPLKRLYLRNLPNNISEDALLKYLSSYGKIEEVKIVHANNPPARKDYAFVQFDSEKDARDVLETFQRQPFLGRNIVVEFARPLRKDMPSSATSVTTDSHSRICPRQAPAHVQSRYPVVVTNIPRNIRWQELKDFGRSFGGLVAYCDLDRKKRGRGFIEYFSNEDAERAVQKLNGRCLGGKQVTVTGIKVIYQRSRSRSCSPIRGQRNSRQRSSSGNTASTPSASDVFYSDATTRRRRDSPPPCYAYRHTPAQYYPTHHSPHYHSPVPVVPIEQETSSLGQYNSSTSRYLAPYGEERYGYTDITNKLGSVENWKYGSYDYGHDAGYYTARRFWEERTERQEFDPLRHYQY